LTPTERFSSVVSALKGRPGVVPPVAPQSSRRRFGSNGLKLDGRLFAMLAGERLVVKLPKRRVDELVSSKDGMRYDPRHDGKVMKEWLSLGPDSAASWLALAEEALDFAGSKA
jgi:hypothetical protein